MTSTKTTASVTQHTPWRQMHLYQLPAPQFVQRAPVRHPGKYAQQSQQWIDPESQQFP